MPPVPTSGSAPDPAAGAADASVPISPNGAGTPLVAVIMAALDETGKIGRVLDKWPEDSRFESIVIDDGSTDGTGDEARAHGAAVVLRHEQRGGVGAAIRTGLKCARERGRPYVAFLAGDDQHEPSDLVGALDAVLARNLDYVQGSRWMPGGHVVGPIGGRGIGTRLYSVIFSVLVFRRVTDATNGFRVFRTAILDDPSIDIDQGWLSRLRARAVSALSDHSGSLQVRRGPCDRAISLRGLHKDARLARLVASAPPGRPSSPRPQTLRRTSPTRPPIHGPRPRLHSGGRGATHAVTRAP